MPRHAGVLRGFSHQQDGYSSCYSSPTDNQSRTALRQPPSTCDSHGDCHRPPALLSNRPRRSWWVRGEPRDDPFPLSSPRMVGTRPRSRSGTRTSHDIRPCVGMTGNIAAPSRTSHSSSSRSCTAEDAQTRGPQMARAFSVSVIVVAVYITEPAGRRRSRMRAAFPVRPRR
jgi:hypothetical protein